MKVNKNKKGFTLIEILLVIAIIFILVVVILVSINVARIRAADVSALQTMRGTADVAYSCLSTFITNVRVSRFDPASSICEIFSGVAWVPSTDYSNWPNISKYNWDTTIRSAADFSTGQNGFYWCHVGSSGSTHPTNVGAWSDGNYGSWASSFQFCYMLKNGGKYIWCTQEGCRKEGF